MSVEGIGDGYDALNALVDAAVPALRLVYYQDHANAAMHIGKVRYSPLTFRLAEALNGMEGVLESLGPEDVHIVATVVTDVGAYAEDPGR